MTFRTTAVETVQKAATALETLAGSMAIVRSVDATESARWLVAVAQKLRELCEQEETSWEPLGMSIAERMISHPESVQKILKWAEDQRSRIASERSKIDSEEKPREPKS